MPFGRLSEPITYTLRTTTVAFLFGGWGNTTDDDGLLSCALLVAVFIVMYIFYALLACHRPPCAVGVGGRGEVVEAFWLWNKFNGGKEIRKLNLLTAVWVIAGLNYGLSGGGT